MSGAPSGFGEQLENPWPATVEELQALQERLGSRHPSLWNPEGEFSVAGCFYCHSPKGRQAWAAAALYRSGHPLATSVVEGAVTSEYQPGYLARREGPLLEQALRGLGEIPEVLLVNATGRDHPRRAGLALHLGAALRVPSVGVTERLLNASGAEPGPSKGATEAIYLDGELVGYWVRTRGKVRPVAAHAAWLTSPEVSRDLVLATATRVRTPEPLRRARHLARRTRAAQGL